MSRLLFTFSALAAIATAQSVDPAAQAISTFYTAYSQHKFDGLPAKPKLAAIQSHLSPSLISALHTAQAHQTACIWKHPDDKGKLLEKRSPCREFVIDFQYTDNGRWLLDDVLYRKQEGFSSGFGAALKQSLTTDPGCR